MSVLEDGTEVVPKDEPPEGFFVPAIRCRNCEHLEASNVTLGRGVNYALTVLREHDLHAEADKLDSDTGGW